MVTAETLLDEVRDFNRSGRVEDENLRAAMLESARALCSKLENPWDSILRMIYMEVGRQILQIMSLI